MFNFQFIAAVAAFAILPGVVETAHASNIQFVSESGWVLPESITYVSSFGALKNQLLIPDPQTSYLYAVPAGGGASKTIASFGTPSSYFGGEGTGSVSGGVILNSGPLAGDYLATGYNYTNPATGAYSGAIFVASPAGTTQVILQTVGANSSKTGGTFYTPIIAPNGFGKLGGDVLVTQDVADAIQVVTPTSASSASLSTFAHLPISPFGELFAPAGFGSVGGDLLVSGYTTGTILAVSGQGRVATFADIPLGAGQVGLRQMAIAPAGFGSYGGDLFVSVASSTVGEGTYGAVDVFSPEGELLAVLSQGSVGAPLDPRGIYFPNNSQVEVVDGDPGLVIAPPSAFTPVTVPEPNAFGLGLLGLLAGLIAYRCRATFPQLVEVCSRCVWRCSALVIAVFGAKAVALADIALPPSMASVMAAAASGGQSGSVSLTLPPTSLPLRAIAQQLYAGAEAVASGGFDPAVAVSASGSDSEGYRAGATAELLYSMEVLGPEFKPVKVDVKAALTDSEGYGNACAGLMISGPSDSINGIASTDQLGSICNDPTLARGSSNDFVHTMLLLQPGVYQVDLKAQVSVGCGGPTNTVPCELRSATAAVDPTFIIDPSFQNAGQYSIVFSANLNSTAPVPEPAVWTLAFGGLGLTSIGLWRKQRSRRADASAAS